MNKEQEAKFKSWYYKPWDELPTSNVDGYEKCWLACCDANGIKTEEPVKDETTAGPYDKQDAPRKKGVYIITNQALTLQTDGSIL